jgi:anti-sigma regulatory factor (Ser/Thr protein kinase)
MEDLSLHILDIAENSIAAGARNLSIVITEDVAADVITIEVGDDGKGMDGVDLSRAADPFYTKRTTRDVGLGLSLLKQAAELTNGKMEMRSAPDVGTTVIVTFRSSHIDGKPLGNMADTVIALLTASEEMNILYIHVRDGKKLVFDSRQFREELAGDTLTSAKALDVIRGFLNQEESALTH